jgi:hypothetical protein
MKTFNKFFSDALLITEDVSASALGAMSEEEFRQFLKGIQDSAKRSQYTRMRQAQVRNAQSPLRPTNPGVTNPGRAPQVPRTNNSTSQNNSKFNKVKDALDPSKASTRAGRFTRGASRFGLAIGADMAADQAINQIPDQGTRETVRSVKDGASTAASIYASPVLGTAFSLTGSSRKDAELPYGDSGYTFSKPLSGKETDQPENDDLDKYTDRFLRTGGTDAKPTYNDPKQKITAYNPEIAKQLRQDPRYTREYIPNPKSNPLNPFSQHVIKNPKYNRAEQEKLKKEYGSEFRIGAAKEGGQIIPVKWGSVAGEKKVGTPQDVAAVKARQRAGQQGAYGSRQGVAVVGTSKNTTFNKKDNTITSGGRTAKLPSTKILAGGRVGDLAYKDGKPVYIARADMAQSGNQNLFARLSRATGIGGQREKDAAALAREREQAMKNTLKYRKDIGAGGGSIGAK